MSARARAVHVRALGDGRQWSARVLLPKGQTLRDMLDRVPKLESALGLRPRAIRVEEDPTMARRVLLRVVERDPHQGTLAIPDLPRPRTITRPIPVGEYETGEPLAVDLLRKHTLIGASSGAGKSTLLNALLHTLGPAPDVLLWAVDFAGGAGLAPWQACLGRLATTPEEARELLEDAVAGIDARERWLADHGRENWEPTPTHPAIVIPIDELAELIEQLPDAAGHLDTIARKGRKTATTLLVATQRPTQDALGGGALRAQLTVRICLRMNELRDGELVLGQGKKALGYRPDLLDAPGKLLIWDPPDHMRPIPAKAYHLDRARIPRALAAAGPGAVPDLDPDTAAALAAMSGQDDRSGPDRTTGPVPDRPRQPAPASASADTVPIPAPSQDGDPLAALRTCLRAAGAGGAKVAELASAIGRAKTWVYERLQDLHRVGEVERAGHGRWRLTHPHDDHDDHDDHDGDQDDGGGHDG